MEIMYRFLITITSILYLMISIFAIPDAYNNTAVGSNFFQGHSDIPSEKMLTVQSVQNSSQLQTEQVSENIIVNNNDFKKSLMMDIMAKKCAHHYSITCLKLDFNRLMDKLGRTRSFQILPGISLVNNVESTANNSIPEEVAVSLVRSNNDDSSSGSTDLNTYLFDKISKYFNSISLRVNLLDNPIIQNIRDFTYDALSGLLSPFDETGRSKKVGKHEHAAAWSAAMLVALGFSGLAALAGKAMLTGAIALVLSLLCVLRGCGKHYGGSSNYYEIITKPSAANIHEQVEHIAGLTGPISVASASAAHPYAATYARNFIEDRVMPLLNVVDTTVGAAASAVGADDDEDDVSAERQRVLIKDVGAVGGGGRRRHVIPLHARYQINTPDYGSSTLIHSTTQ